MKSRFYQKAFSCVREAILFLQRGSDKGEGVFYIGRSGVKRKGKGEAGKGKGGRVWYRHRDK